MGISIISSCGWKLLQSVVSPMSSKERAHTNMRNVRTHMRAPMDAQSNSHTRAESFTEDKRHPVGFTKRKREGEFGRKSSSSTLLLFSFTSSLSFCAEETSPLSLRPPVSTLQLVSPLLTTTSAGG